MKKGFLFSILAVLAAATIANAAPRFGAVAQTGGNNGANIGAILTDDMYNASLLLGNESTDDAGDPSQLSLNFNANYKIALDSATSATVGIGYTMQSGDVILNGAAQPNQEHDGSNAISLNAGIERALSSNITLVADVQVFTSTTLKSKTAGATTESKTTGIFNSGRVGVAYLF